MGRLIDLDNLLEDMIHCNIGRKSLEEVIKCLNAQPIFEAVPEGKVDVILDRLKNVAFWTPQTYDEDGFGNDDSEEVVMLDRALEIVYETDRDGQSDLFKALHRAVLALEKQIPRETVINEEEGYIECPSCGGMISYMDDPTSHKFCLKCGQAFACNYLQYADNETAQSGLMPAT